MAELVLLAVDRDPDGTRHRHRRKRDRGVLRLDDLVPARRLLGCRIARRERLGTRLVFVELDAEARERLEERLLRPVERHPVLRAARPGDRGLDLVEVELHDLRVLRMGIRLVPEQVLAAVGLDEGDAELGSPRQPQVVERQLVDREEPARRAVLRRHVPERRPVCDREPRDPVAEVLDELPHDPGVAEQLDHGEHEVGRRRSLAQATPQPEADDLRHEHRERLAEQRRLRLDPAHTPAEHPEPVHHRRVRVEADHGVGKCHAVSALDHACEVLEVHLVDDSRARRDDLEVVERCLTPAQELVPLTVALDFELDVAGEGEPRGELVHLHRMVDHELGRDQRVDPSGVSAELGDRVPHRGEIDDGRDAREVLEQHPRREERDLVCGVGVGIPRRDGARARLVARAEHVLEQHAERIRQAPRFCAGERVDARDLVRLPGDRECAHAPESSKGCAVKARIHLTDP